MKTRKLIFGLAVALMAIGVQSCGGQTRPENRSGHDLWFYDITKPVNAVNKELLGKYDSQLGD